MSSETLLSVALGAVLGFVRSQAVEIYRISKETKIRQKERLVNKRIEAHERVMSMAQQMIAMRPVVAKLADGDEGIPRGPWVLESEETFQDFYSSFIDANSSSSTWLWIETKRELNYCQDYLLTLYGEISKNPGLNFDQLSGDVRQDFIDIAENLRKTSMDYLTLEMPKLKFDDLNKKPKYKRSITIQRLLESQLGLRYLKKVAESR